MAASRYLALDFGAESGRAILGTLEDGRITLEEIHRFPNRQVRVHGHVYWDVLYLFDELKKGLAAAANRGCHKLDGIGVDTWGVDYGLLDANGELLGHPHSYRDPRTEGMPEAACNMVPKAEIFAATGTQFMPFNTLFQLLSQARAKSPALANAKTLLFMPDLFNYLLTGKKCAEYTIASTSQMMNAKKRAWSKSLLQKLGLPANILPKIMAPGTLVGPLLPQILQETGLAPVNVYAPGGHDTACAVAAVPATEGGNWAYLSSGTWSLLGVELDEPDVSPAALANGFTNEGGVGGKIRFLRNCTGLWLLQQTRRHWQQQGDELSYAEIAKLAVKAEDSAFQSIVDADDPAFRNPADMPAAIVDYCRRTGQTPPKTKGEFARCILESLAFKYRVIINKINAMREEPVERLHIVGGGSQNELLCQLAADACGIPVVAGPVEATALGNVLMQALAAGKVKNLAEARRIVAKSVLVRHYEPKNPEEWDLAWRGVKPLFG